MSPTYTQRSTPSPRKRMSMYTTLCGTCKNMRAHAEYCSVLAHTLYIFQLAPSSKKRATFENLNILTQVFNAHRHLPLPAHPPTVTYSSHRHTWIKTRTCVPEEKGYSDRRSVVRRLVSAWVNLEHTCTHTSRMQSQTRTRTHTHTHARIHNHPYTRD